MNKSNQQTNERRRFLGLMAVSGTALAGLSFAPLPNGRGSDDGRGSETLVGSAPVLQCPCENEITVVWVVGQPAAGYVELGTEKDKLDQKATGAIFGANPYNDRFLQVRIEGLKPNTRYYYRTVTSPFTFKTSHSLLRGEPVFSDVYSFVTPSAEKASGSFSTINDTHCKDRALKLVMPRLAKIGSDYTIWNGDLVDGYDNADLAVRGILNPAGAPFAAERPLLFVPGNHDYRGQWARSLPLALPPWKHSDPQDQKMGRNFVVRTGPLALIGLDTGEDKPDWHPAWQGMASFEPYRIEQRNWLERALKSPAVATAPFVVAFCHIPIFDSRPDANGGDVLERWASFQRQAGNLWGPLLKEHGVQLLVAAHMHRFRFDAPTEDRPWAQIVGGGHEEKGQVTVIHGQTNGDTLEVAVDELNKDTELGRWTFKKRNV